MTGSQFFNAALNRIMRRYDITQYTMCDELSVGQNTITNWRKNTDSVRLYYLREIDRKYGLTDAEIIGMVRGGNKNEAVQKRR